MGENSWTDSHRRLWRVGEIFKAKAVSHWIWGKLDRQQHASWSLPRPKWMEHLSLLSLKLIRTTNIACSLYYGSCMLHILYIAICRSLYAAWKLQRGVKVHSQSSSGEQVSTIHGYWVSQDSAVLLDYMKVRSIIVLTWNCSLNSFSVINSILVISVHFVCVLLRSEYFSLWYLVVAMCSYGVIAL